MAVNILVVEDEPAIQELIAVNLENAGQTLLNGGHVVYLGAEADGILGFIDASERHPSPIAVQLLQSEFRAAYQTD